MDWKSPCAGIRRIPFGSAGPKTRKSVTRKPGTTRKQRTGEKERDELLHPSHGRTSPRATDAGEDSHRGAGWAAELGQVDALQPAPGTAAEGGELSRRDGRAAGGETERDRAQRSGAYRSAGNLQPEYLLRGPTRRGRCTAWRHAGHARAGRRPAGAGLNAPEPPADAC